MGILPGKEVAPSVTIDVEDAADKTKTTKVVNPDYTLWLAKDQHLLGYLNSTMSREVLAQVARITTSSEVWTHIQSMFASQSRSRLVHLRQRLATTRKGDMSCAAYYSKMTGIVDDMASAGKKVDDEDVVAYILTGLDAEYNPFVESICRQEVITLSDLYTQLLSTEACLESQQQSYISANATSRGRGSPFRGRGGGRGGRDGGRGDYGDVIGTRLVAILAPAPSVNSARRLGTLSLSVTSVSTQVSLAKI